MGRSRATLPRKGAKSRTHGRKLRSTGTKSKGVARSDEQADLEKKLEARTRELGEARNHLAEALEQQTATSEVLKVISSSPGDLAPVFQAMLQNSVAICQATFGQMFLYEADAVRMVARLGVPAALAEFDEQRGVFQPAPGGGLDRVRRTSQVVHFADMSIENVENPVVRLGGARSYIAVPMLKENELIGVISIYRQEVRPFTDKQIELVQNFAAQAVIAIENTRLLNELRESLQQQTATADVLSVISSSAGELNLVFNVMLAKATELCEASYGTLWLRDGDGYRAAAIHGDLPTLFVEQWRSGTLYRPDPEVTLARSVRARKPIQEADLRTTPQYLKGDPLPVTAVDIAGIRTLMVVPMLKDNEPIGGIAIYRKEVRPFGEKQIELVTNFAAQAVIAIENTRLLNELRESLQQQTATADVLKAISRSIFDLQPVLEALTESATRLCGAKRGHIFQFDGEFLRLAAAYGAWPGFMEYLETHPLRPGPGTVAGRAAFERRTIHVCDVLQERAYELPELIKQQGYRTVLAVPMLRERSLRGVITILKTELEPFTDKQIELLTTFADQAVIAIENVRLFDEVQARTRDLSETLEQQTATANVLEVIGRSAFNLQPVFETVAESTVRLCGADKAIILRYDGELLRIVVGYNTSAELKEFMEKNPIRPGRGSSSGRAALERRTIHIHDVQADPEYTYGSKYIDPIRTLLTVPMLKGDDLLGVMIIYRLEVKPFTDKQVELVETFADQAAIAIENVRLFEEVQARTGDLARSARSPRRSTRRSSCRPCSTPSSPIPSGFPGPMPARSTCSTSGKGNSSCARRTA
jgi:GAF domain-containing protein